jgi:predicted HD phosphohydrolase
MTDAYNEACTATKLTDRALALLTQLDSPSTKLGARVSLYEHSLQTATRALRGGEDEETVVVALLHDVGELMSPSSHGDIANAMLLPYISPKNQWVLAMHEIFQGYHYFHHAGLDRDSRDNYKDHEFFQACKDFCDKYDQKAFDERYTSLPLETFRPMVERIFSRKAYWWNPSHPKAGAVTG